MTFKELKNKIKEEQKTLAQKIREHKSQRKLVKYGYVEGLVFNQYKYRHTHIAYCTFFNNTPYEKIESKCHEKPSSRKLDDLKKKWESQIDEALRDCA
jgi:hypothetical protein